ncbi:ADP-ribosylation factor GTPase-activating protein AGD7-like [Iris pallida]|uniref:ADP-ribosylation factor GTPase-activating protein AGD7-like n=1 Tax=Iris pallida TaxID=29817 RepID=A0AAX6HUH3_IRIPA|nr:ADP-ribosylation factor GTPase-activating protein AGD7-like [Iris pallida]
MDYWSGKHRGLGVHISFVYFVTMDSWYEIQLKKMEAGGNNILNSFLSQYGVPKETDIVSNLPANESLDLSENGGMFDWFQ